MVQLPNPDKFRSESKQPITPALVTVKAEIEDSLDEMYGPLDKRSRIADPVEQLENKLIPPCSFYDPLDEPSPLGLRLKKSPSFLDMIQMRLYQENSASTSSTTGPGLDVGKKKELKSTAVSGSLDKMKASNFPASILKIGNWEYASRYEGDLVAKCYYAKHKLVWEVLDGGLKNKIEIQWSDITALKAACPENGPATLDIVLARRPLFFRETNPQPRKHTLWQATSDFTGGQASIHKRHFLQCHQGLLNRHFEKLIQCDPRLKTLNLQPEIVLESACFEPVCFEDHDESKCLGFENVKDNHRSTDGFHEPKLPCAKTESRDRVDAVLDISAGQMHFRDAAGASVISVHNKAIEDNVYNENRQASKPWMQWEQQLKAPRLRSSMSKDDLVNHLEHCISEQLASGNPLFSAGCLPDKGKLEELADHLLTDSHAFVSDEKSLISKVNSFCSLLQKDPSFQNLHSTSTEHRQYFEEEEEEEDDDDDDDEHKQFTERKAADDLQPCGGGMARKESFGELLMNLPRIASFPQFLFCIAEDNDD